MDFRPLDSVKNPSNKQIYETQWKEYIQLAIAKSFPTTLLKEIAITQEDREYLTQLLESMKPQEDDFANKSFEYSTPYKPKSIKKASQFSFSKAFDPDETFDEKQNILTLGCTLEKEMKMISPISAVNTQRSPIDYVEDRSSLSVQVFDGIDSIDNQDICSTTRNLRHGFDLSELMDHMSIIDTDSDEESDTPVEQKALKTSKVQGHIVYPGLPIHSSDYKLQLKISLENYQQQAVKWMYAREYGKNLRQGQPKVLDLVRGGILADDMGLGKTVCCLALLQFFQEQTQEGIVTYQGPTLVVTPLSLLMQWKQEIMSKTNFRVTCYHGQHKNRIRNQRDAMQYDIVLTTYETLKTKECRMSEKRSSQTEWISAVKTNGVREKRLSRLHLIDWHRVILDESHFICNSQTLRTQSTYMLRSHIRWCVTGTPIQNKTSDLLSLFQFLGIADTNDDVEDLLPFLLLRREKSTVDPETMEKLVSLPHHEIQTKYLEFEFPAERQIYQAVFQSTARLLQPEDTPKPTKHILEQLMQLRQICNSVNLLAKYKSQPHPSTKLTTLVSDVQELLSQSATSSCIVVSQWTTYLDIIQATLTHELGHEYKIGRLDGTMTSQRRIQVIEDFQQQQKYRILLLSLKAGGIGLNLTSASSLILMEPSYNPFNEQQAIDRIHRYGQQMQTKIIRYIIQDTIEERIIQLQNKKKTLAANLLKPTNDSWSCGEPVLTGDMVRLLMSESGRPEQ